MAQIVYRDDNFQTLYADVNAQHPEVTIGRHQENMLVIAKKALSRHHAKALYQNGRYYLIDLNSSNGTYVNNLRITQQEIKPGDVLRFGDVCAEFIEGSANAHPNLSMSQNVPPASIPRQAPPVSIPSQGMMPPRPMPPQMPQGLTASPSMVLGSNIINRPITGNGSYRPTMPNQPSYDEDMAMIEASNALLSGNSETAPVNAGMVPPARNAAPVMVPPSVIPPKHTVTAAPSPSKPPVRPPETDVTDAPSDSAVMSSTFPNQVSIPEYIQPSEATCAEPLDDIIQAANAENITQDQQDSIRPSEIHSPQNIPDTTNDPNAISSTGRLSHDPAVQRRQSRGPIFGSNQERNPSRIHPQAPQHGTGLGRNAPPQRQKSNTGLPPQVLSGHDSPDDFLPSLDFDPASSEISEIPSAIMANERAFDEFTENHIHPSDSQFPHAESAFDSGEPGSRSVIIEMPLGSMDDSSSETTVPHVIEDHPPIRQKESTPPAESRQLKAELLAKMSEIDVLKNQIEDLNTRLNAAGSSNTQAKYQELEARHQEEIARIRKEIQQQSQKQLDEINAKHDAEIAQLNADHEEALARLQSTNQDSTISQKKIQGIETRHQEEIARIRKEIQQQSQKQLDEINAKHDAEIAQLNADHEEALARLQTDSQESAVSQAQIEELKSKHQEEITKLKAEIQQQAQAHFDELLNERMDEINAKHNAEIAQLNADHEEALARMQSEPHESNISNDQLEEIEAKHQEEIARIKEEIQAQDREQFNELLNERLDELTAQQEAELAQLNAEHEELINKLRTNPEDLFISPERMAEIESNHQTALSEAKEQTQRECDAKYEAILKEKTDELNAKHDAEIAQFKQKEESAEAEISKLKDEVTQIQNNNKDEVARYEEQITDLKDQIRQKTEWIEQNDHSEAMEKYEDQIAELKSHITQLQDNIEEEIEQAAQEAADDTAAHFKEKIAILQQNQQQAIEQAANDAADETAAHFEERIAELQQTQQEEIDKAVVEATQKYEAQIADLHQIQQVAVEKAIKETNEQAAQKYESQITQLQQEVQDAVKRTEQTFQTQIEELKTKLESHDTDCTDEFKRLWRSRFSDMIGYAESLDKVAGKLSMESVDAQSIEHIHSMLDVLRFCAAELEN